LAERLGVSLFDLRVEEVSLLTPSMRRIRLAAEGLAALGARPGQDMMCSFADNGSIVRRRYSIRQVDTGRESMLVDIVLHGDGPGARWAAGAAPGDVIEAIGPRGKVTIRDAARWHLFVGDESFLPAIFSMVESLPVDQPAVVVLEVDGPNDELPLDAVSCPQGPDWLHRDPSAAGFFQGVLARLPEFELPPGRGHAYVGGELSGVAAVRDLLVARGLESEQISAKAYWRAGSSNASHGEPAP
jgi:NADPH-dependent ferric siderophore reductase